MGRRLAAGAFRVVVVLHAVLAVAQPVAAGAVLQASVLGLEVHRAVGGLVLVVGMVLVPLAVLARRPGRLPAWPIAVVVGLVVAEIAQVAVGVTGVLVVHVPLGVAIVATAVALGWWALRVGPRSLRLLRRPDLTGSPEHLDGSWSRRGGSDWSVAASNPV